MYSAFFDGNPLSVVILCIIISRTKDAKLTLLRINLKESVFINYHYKSSNRKQINLCSL